MVEVGASADVGAVAALVAISFFSFLAGVIFRKWPDKVREYVEGLDGSLLLLTEEAHRAVIEVCGLALIAMSIAALVAAALLL